MARKLDGVLQVRYVKNSEVGIIIEKLKEKGLNISQIIREYIILINGYECLKDTSISRTELQKICIKNLQFFIEQYEITKINLEQEKQLIAYNNPLVEVPIKNVSSNRDELKEFRERKKKKIRKVKDKSLIDSLL